jgi:hypothetical protein
MCQQTGCFQARCFDIAFRDATVKKMLSACAATLMPKWNPPLPHTHTPVAMLSGNVLHQISCATTLLGSYISCATSSKCKTSSSVIVGL